MREKYNYRESFQAFEYQILSVTPGKKSSELEEGKYKGRC